MFYICKFYGEINNKELLTLEEQGKIIIDNEKEIIFIKDNSAIETLKKYSVETNNESNSYELYEPTDLIEFIFSHCYDMTVDIDYYTRVSVDLEGVEGYILKNIEKKYNYTYKSICEIMEESLREGLKEKLQRVLRKIDTLKMN